MTNPPEPSPNEIADTYEALRNLDNLLDRLTDGVSDVGNGEATSNFEVYRNLVRKKRDTFGEAQATRNPFKITDYRDAWGNEYPTITTAELTPTERAFLCALKIVGPDETVRLPVGPDSGDRLPVVVQSNDELLRAVSILGELNPVSTPTTLLHMSDTHLGFRLRGTHPDAGGSIPSWSHELRPNLAFAEALSTAIVRGVDAVVHTGDLFDHNVDRSSVERFRSMLIELHENGIPFYCILGDHDRGATGGAFPGDADAMVVLAELVGAGLVTLLDTDPKYVGTVALYGLNATNIGLDEIRNGRYDLDYWQSPEISFGMPTDDSRSVLCLHERTAPPYEPEENPTCELDHHLPDKPDFDLFAVGHEHSPAETCSWNGAKVTYSGPTQRFSKGWPDLIPSVSLIEIPPEGEISIEHIPLSAGNG